MTFVKQTVLDTAAMGMAVVCGVHCLLTPLLLVFLPVLADSFWVHEDFHGWMLLLVVPTTVLAVFMGCKKHRNKKVIILSTVGLALLVGASVAGSGSADSACCPSSSVSLNDNYCEVAAASVAEAGMLSPLSGLPLSAESLWTCIGGLFLAAGHFSNFWLCHRSRADECTCG